MGGTGAHKVQIWSQLGYFSAVRASQGKIWHGFTLLRQILS